MTRPAPYFLIFSFALPPTHMHALSLPQPALDRSCALSGLTTDVPPATVSCPAARLRVSAHTRRLSIQMCTVTQPLISSEYTHVATSQQGRPTSDARHPRSLSHVHSPLPTVLRVSMLCQAPTPSSYSLLSAEL